MAVRRVNDAASQYMDKLTKEIVAESGNPQDMYHLGKLVLKTLREHPDAINQIDGGTDESETNASVLARSTLLASCLRKFGMEKGDVICLMAPNHLDVCIPYYAALYLGVIIMAADRTLSLRELTSSFKIGKPKVIFCQSEKAPEIQLALNQNELDSQIVTFDGGDYLCSLSNFIEKYNDPEFIEQDFQASEYNGADTTAFIIATSGTTGLPKAAALTHKNFVITGPFLWCKFTQFPTPTAIAMIGSPLQWLTALMNFLLSPIFTYIRLQTSKQMTQEHCYELINKYRPTWTVLSPTMVTTLLKMPDRLQCDFTCFEQIFLGGSAVSADIIDKLKDVAVNAEVNDVYGMSELAGVGLMSDGEPVPGSSGKPIACLEYQLINVDTGEEILEPFVPGELWLRGPGIFKEYYTNPEATEETFADGRWFKTGDVFYRDAMHNYFYVDRIKLMLKYKSFQISPVELENLIRTHEDVVDVAITSVPDPECGDLVVACVVRRAGSQVSAQDIKDIVKNNLTDSKQLRGGVVFLEEMPMTASTKIHRRKLKEMVLSMERE